MAKKTKTKQKSEEKTAGNNVGSTAGQPEPSIVSATVTEINYKADPPAEQASAWGTDTGAWGMPDAQPTGDTWGTSGHESEEAWGDHPESLLQPPQQQNHGVLPTIPEHSSPGGHSSQIRRSLSDIGESQLSHEYGDDWSGEQQSHNPHYADALQSHTLTATAASAMGTPAMPPTVSLNEAVSRAQAQTLVGQKVSKASEAARKLEQSRAHLNVHPTTNTNNSPAVRYEPLKDNSNHAQGGHTPMSSASAAAALLESTSNRLKAQGHATSKPTKPTVHAPPGKTQWEYHGRPAAAIKPDYSWIMTGGNAWSNKHRQAKGATVHWGPGNENAWGQQIPQHGQQQPHQQQQHPGMHQAHQRPQHQKHHSHPPQVMHQQRPKSGQSQGWQGWGKDGWAQEEQSETETEGTLDGWGQQGDGWGQASANGWGDQHAAGWGQQPQQNRQPQGRGKQDHGRSHGPKPAEDGWGQANGWDRQGDRQGDQWGQGETGWNQSNDGWSQNRDQGRGQGQGRRPNPSDNGWGNDDGWGQQQDNGWGKAADTGWGKPADAGWDKTADAGWGGNADTGWGNTADAGWGAGGEGRPTSNAEWGAKEAGPSRNPVSEQQKTQIMNSLLNQGQTQKAPPSMTPAQLQATQQQVAQLQLQLAAIQGAIVQGQKSGNMTAAQLQATQQHGGQIQTQLKMLLNAMGQTQKNANMTTAQHQAAQQQAAQLQAQMAALQGTKLPSKTTHHGGKDVWEAYDEDGWGSMDSSDDEYDSDRRVHFSPRTSDIWGGSPRSVPSKALLQAQQQQGIATTPLNLTSNVRFVESRGAAFAFVSNAFFGNTRLARERIHWLFPSNKDQRVADMLGWVQKMSFNLATFGLTKFLETRERGALFVNVVFRMQQHPKEPAFDWLTFNQLQGTMDKTLQESTAFYDPARLVTVFVYLPSQSGNSVAIWRRKINVPDSARLKYQAEINAVMKTLRTEKEYVVMVDELPKPKPKGPQKPGQLRKSIKSIPAKKVKSPTKDAQKAQKKRKWWKFFLS